MAELSDVETLREAARQMRDQAERAEPKRWRAGHGASHESVVFVNEPGPDAVIIGTFLIEGDGEEAEWVEDDDNAAHSASWDPIVAQKTADLLDAVAMVYKDGPMGVPQPIWDRALTVARIYLRIAP